MVVIQMCVLLNSSNYIFQNSIYNDNIHIIEHMGNNISKKCLIVKSVNLNTIKNYASLYKLSNFNSFYFVLI